MIESFNPVEIRDKWKSKNVTIGKRVSAVGHDFSFDGVASDISLDGSLIIVDGKKEIVFNYGDLRHLQ